MSFIYNFFLLYPYWFIKTIIHWILQFYKNIFCLHINENKIDQLSGFEFELLVQKLLIKSGYHDVKITQASGDYGIDILAEKEGVTYAIQCKRYNAPVGVKAVQEAYTGRDFYDRMVGCVLTNQYFTQPAVDAAQKLKILLWDRDYLEEMIEEGC